MGKNKNKRKQKQLDDPSKKMKIHHRGGGQDANVSSVLRVPVNARQHSQQLVTAPIIARKVSSKLNSAQFPPAFPHDEGLIVPKDDFLKCVHPYEQSFKRAIDTAYEGFVVDDDAGEGINTKSTGSWKGNNIKAKSPIFDHEAIQRALKKMDQAGIFLTDVTQPRGLGTKCAKTYVTRCLLGDEGTTYKYLGLRMFAHPWSVKPASKGLKDSNVNNGSYSVDDALSEISKLNDTLTERTKHHLVDLEKKRKQRMGFQTNGDSYISGRAKFDITLINRMTNSPDLKLEPTQKKHKCSVSWHADSSLEHYSSIGVYQTIISDNGNNEKKKELKKMSLDEEQKQKLRRENELAKRWAVALRVAHDSEGPAASRRGTNIDAAVVKETPVISVSMPSRSAYYLLDDFNHHHQHAVLVDNDNDHDQSTAGVRYASTHRLLRESHNVNFVLERCRCVCSQFHKKGVRVWKTEQTCLFSIESSWIRQFYIQGQGHKDNLWKVRQST